MPFGWAVAAAAVSSAIKTNQKNKASARANDAQQAGIAEAREDVTAANQQAQGRVQPITDQGNVSRERLNDATGTLYSAGAQGINTLQGQTGKLNVNQFLDPSADYSMKQANQALQESAAARGGLLSGATLKALNEQSSHMAQQNYNNAAQLALNNRQQQIGVGNSLVDVGRIGVGVDSNLNAQGTQGAFNQAQMDSQLGSDLANASISSGNSNAANQANRGSVLGGAVTGALDTYSGGSNANRGQMNSAIGSFFSDQRVKHGVEDVSDQEIDEFLSKMAPKSFEYDEKVIDKGASDSRSSGVMAQDAEKSKVGKTLVKEDSDGDKMLDGPKTVSALLATAVSLNKRLKKVEGKK